jgi:hypothetical protein
MLVTLLDAAAEPHQVSWQGQDQINDYSGALQAAAVGAGAVPQIAAAANQNRAGFLFQNTSANPMLLLEVSSLEITSAFFIPSGGFFPPIPGYPIPTGELLVQGSPASEVGDTFVLRDWQSAQGE